MSTKSERDMSASGKMARERAKASSTGRMGPDMRALGLTT